MGSVEGNFKLSTWDELPEGGKPDQIQSSTIIEMEPPKSLEYYCLLLRRW